ncbi:MAG: PadR family transcriptional regulator [Vicinamibacteria bacterium]
MLKPADFLILLALAEKERHGYGIRQDLAQATEGALWLDAGNLYRSIHRLLDSDLLARSGRKTAHDAADERRVYYRLTPKGRAALAAEARRMQGLLRLGKVRKLLSERAF